MARQGIPFLSTLLILTALSGGLPRGHFARLTQRSDSSESFSSQSESAEETPSPVAIESGTMATSPLPTTPQAVPRVEEWIGAGLRDRFRAAPALPRQSSEASAIHDEVKPSAPARSKPPCVQVQECSASPLRLYESADEEKKVWGLYNGLFNLLTANSRGSVSDTIAETIGEVNGERIRDCAECVTLSPTAVECSFESRVGATFGDGAKLLLTVVDSAQKPLQVESARYRSGNLSSYGRLEVLYKPVTLDREDLLIGTPKRAVQLAGAPGFLAYPFFTQTCRLIEQCGERVAQPAAAPTNPPTQLPASFTPPPFSALSASGEAAVSRLMSDQCVNQYFGGVGR